LSIENAALHVLIADSAQLRLQLIGGALSRRSDFHVSRCALDTTAILAFLNSQGADVLLVNMEQNGNTTEELDCVRRVHLALPSVPIVLLVSAYDRELVVTGFRSGARGIFCFANTDFRMLCKCLRCVQKGQVWANSEQLGMLLESVVRAPLLRVTNAAGQQLLSPREEQVVALVAEGLSNGRIATELHLSENTVKKYMFKIFEKLGISSRVELVLYAVASGSEMASAARPGC
jgi:DNA-binding NarL/FixJ family response regulator